MYIIYVVKNVHAMCMYSFVFCICNRVVCSLHGKVLAYTALQSNNTLQAYVKNFIVRHIYIYIYNNDISIKQHSMILV